jgi:hypothetical protein
MLHKIDNIISTHVSVLQRIKVHGVHSDIDNGRSKYKRFMEPNPENKKDVEPV